MPPLCRSAPPAATRRRVLKSTCLSLGVAALALGLACTEEIDLGSTQLASAPDTSDGGAANEPSLAGWGAYAATLAVRSCDGGEVWVVDSTDAELEGGPTLSTRAEAGETLSLREALFLAANRPGSDTVLFDPGVFRDEAPGIIRLSGEALFPPAIENVCIDGRRRGVVLSWKDCTEGCAPVLARDSLVVGLQFVNAPTQLHVSNSQVAGSRFRVSYRAVYAGAGALVGPGNAFGSGEIGVETIGANTSDLARISGNSFGLDPVSRVVEPPSAAIYVFDPAIVEGNDVASPTSFISSAGPGGRVRRNRFAGLLIAGGHGWIIEDNVFEQGLQSLTSVGVPSNTVTRNTFSHPEFFVAIDQTAPIQAGSATGASGACPAAGDIEVYGRLPSASSEQAPSASSGRAFRFFADVKCQSDGRWEVAFSSQRIGTTLRTLFTNSATHNTGKFSDEFIIR